MEQRDLKSNKLNSETNARKFKFEYA